MMAIVLVKLAMMMMINLVAHSAANSSSSVSPTSSSPTTTKSRSIEFDEQIKKKRFAIKGFIHIEEFLDALASLKPIMDIN